MSGGADLERWLSRVSPRDLHTTVMTRAEIRYVLARLPSGRRRRDLTARADALFEDVSDRLLPFDAPAADRYGELVASRTAAGQPVSVADAIIASIAGVHRAALATRNQRDFVGCGIEVINPFDS